MHFGPSKRLILGTLTDFVQKVKTIHLNFQQVQTLIRGLLQEPSDLGLNSLKKNNMDSLQRA